MYPEIKFAWLSDWDLGSLFWYCTKYYLTGFIIGRQAIQTKRLPVSQTAPCLAPLSIISLPGNIECHIQYGAWDTIDIYYKIQAQSFIERG